MTNTAEIETDKGLRMHSYPSPEGTYIFVSKYSLARGCRQEIQIDPDEIDEAIEFLEGLK